MSRPLLKWDLVNRSFDPNGRVVLGTGVFPKDVFYDGVFIPAGEYPFCEDFFGRFVEIDCAIDLLHRNRRTYRWEKF